MQIGRLTHAKCTGEPSRDPDPVRRPGRLSVILPIGQALRSGACFRLGAVRPSRAEQTQGSTPGEVKASIDKAARACALCPVQGAREGVVFATRLSPPCRRQGVFTNVETWRARSRQRRASATNLDEAAQGACVVSYPLGTKHGATFKYPTCNASVAR